MRSRRLVPPGIIALPVLILAGGCHYIHFGSPEKFRTEASVVTENSDLRAEKKMLQLELSIARREQDVLRAAIDRPAAPNTAGEELAAKLKATTRELVELRASYARLQAERERLPGAAAPANTPGGRLAAAEQIADLRGRMGETEDKLADALRNYTQLQGETQQLRAALDQSRSENAALAQKLDRITAQNNEARSALSQLNTEFLAQKEARAEAEQAAEALRTQLHAMAAANAKTDAAPSLASARESAAGGAREIEATLHAGNLPADSDASATLATSQAKLQLAGRPAAGPPAVAAPAARPVRTYIVQEGDSLEKISQKFYGRPDRWSLVYGANSALLGTGQALAAGMQLRIPEE